MGECVGKLLKKHSKKFEYASTEAIRLILLSSYGGNMSDIFSIADRVRSTSLVHQRVLRCLTWPRGVLLAGEIMGYGRNHPKISLELSLHRDLTDATPDSLHIVRGE